MSEDIILYDLATAQDPPRAWSINTLKTRIYLNFKKLPYKTIRIPLHNVALELESAGFEPKSEGLPFSVPAIVWKDRKIQDSVKIAAALEEAHPSPSAHLDDPAVERAAKNCDAAFAALRPILAGPIFRKHFAAEDGEHMLARLKARFGVSSVAEISDTSDKAWTTCDEAMAGFVEQLKGDTSGPFILGKGFSYADVYLGAVLLFAQNTDDEAYERLIRQDAVLSEFADALKPYIQKLD